MGNQSGLFGDLGEHSSEVSAPEGIEARYQRPVRDQVEFESHSLDQLLPLDHSVRLVWAAVEGLDFGAFYGSIKAVSGHPGRPPIDPKILFALWVYATLDGVGSARRLAELCVESTPYRWLCGSVGVNHHALSDFRTGHGNKIRQLMIEHVASLRAAGLVELKQVTQDGMKVRACAGAGSFRREGKLRQYLREADEQITRLEQEASQAPGATRTREEAARERAAREQKERLESALEAMRRVREMRAKTKIAREDRRDPGQARASTTDPDARAMRMADGGTRPAYNAQFVTDTKAGVVLDVGLAESGADQNELPPRLDAVKDAYGEVPAETIVDAGYFTNATIEHAKVVGTKLYMPVRQRKREPKKQSEAIREYRERMATPEGQAVLKKRGQCAELVHARARNRGLTRLLVRGRRKVLAVLTWFAIAHNFAIAASLG